MSKLWNSNNVCVGQVSEKLPPTSYIKTIDIWLLFNLSVPFALILLHTYMDKLKEYVRDKMYPSKLLWLHFRQFGDTVMSEEDGERRERYNRYVCRTINK